VKTFDNRPARPAQIPERFGEYFRADAETGKKVLMKSLISSTLFACLGVALAHAAKAEEIHRKLEAAATGTVSIENTAGSVLVRGWSNSEVEVSGDLGNDVEELVFERDGNVVNVHVRTKRRSGRAIDAALVVRVPERSTVRIGGVSLDIEVTNVRGPQRLSTVSGDVSSRVYEADVDIESVSGDIDVQGGGENARTHVNTVSGDIDVIDLAGEIEITSVSGDLGVSGGRWSRVKANTTSGDFDFKGQLLGNGRLDVETINGDLELHFDDDLSAEIDVETFNGDIDNCFGPKPARTSRYAPGRELKFTEGGGEARVTIRTLNGDLRLCKN
jgi:DUF4097 and DUF4098 domain-containing protein YvlB